MIRFRWEVRDAKRRAKAVAKQTGNRAYTFVLVGDQKYEVRCFPGLKRAKITKV